MNKIERILKIEDVHQALDDLMDLFFTENSEQGHQFLLHDLQSIKKSLINVSMLTWDFFIWANKKEDKYDAIIIFVNDKNIKFGIPIFSEFLWLSKNPKVGYKLLKQAILFAKSKNFKYITMSTVVKSLKYKKLKSFYKKIGLVKDSENYIGKL